MLPSGVVPQGFPQLFPQFGIDRKAMTPFSAPQLAPGLGPPVRRSTFPCARGAQMPASGDAKKVCARQKNRFVRMQIVAFKMGSPPKARFLRRPLDANKMTPPFGRMVGRPTVAWGALPSIKKWGQFWKLLRHFLDPTFGAKLQLCPTPWPQEEGSFSL